MNTMKTDFHSDVVTLRPFMFNCGTINGKLSYAMDGSTLALSQDDIDSCMDNGFDSDKVAVMSFAYLATRHFAEFTDVIGIDEPDTSTFEYEL